MADNPEKRAWWGRLLCLIGVHNWFPQSFTASGLGRASGRECSRCQKYVVETGWRP